MMSPRKEGLLMLRRMSTIKGTSCALRDGGGLLGTMSKNSVCRL